MILLPPCLQGCVITFPVTPSGSSPRMTKDAGILKSANLPKQCAASSVTEAWALVRNITYATTSSPNLGSGTPMTATACTAGWVAIMFSTSTGAMFAPPRIIMSFNRPVR